ncbi:MAG TPA: LLM class flavin-dependent oxidoreductase, partial [Solirubrobacterales bacterium]|nr:LLM class flavin-dependent oxidoreductase [Solirubrobacterales bacterium]
MDGALDKTPSDREEGRHETAMKFDYFVTHTRSDASKPYEELYADGLEQIRLCEEMGIDTIWFPEHQFTNQLCSPAPLINVVDAAHRTRRARLGTAVVITPYYNPLLVAGQVALADQLTRGRLEIGFGRGGFKYEYERLEMTEPIAAARQQEALEVILRAWTETDFAYAGTHFKFPEVTVVP